MEINTKFSLGDVAYPKYLASQGEVVPVIVDKITISVESTQIIVIVYRVANNGLFNNTMFNEDDLIDLDEAKVLACETLQVKLDEIQNNIDEIGC
jgi:hypothetical protein